MQFQPRMWDPSLVGDAGTNNMMVLNTNPTHNDTGVDPAIVYIIRAHHPDYSLVLAQLQVYVNGIEAYSGGEFRNGFVGIYREEFGGFVIGLVPPENLGFNDQGFVKAGLVDSSFNIQTAFSGFNLQANPLCYVGNAALPIERQLTQPLTTFLEVEPLRKFLLGAAVNTNTSADFKNNKAARVVYQLAYSTELSSILNPHMSANEDALQAIVCEQNKVIDIASKLEPKRDQVIAALQELQTHGVLPREYVTTLFDYLDSTLFNYKASLVANIVLLAKAVEMAQ
jgi:hypothetical protein